MAGAVYGRLVGALGALALGACDGASPAEPEPERVAALFWSDVVPRGAPAPAATVRLGALLFGHRLGAAACTDCHPRDQLGHDGRAHGAPHGRDTPALADVARQTWFGPDGAAIELTTFVARELAARHGLDAEPGDTTVRAAIAADSGLRDAFRAVHPDGEPTRARVAAALAAWLTTWRTRGRWDRYVDGDTAALTAQERRGLATFVAVGCAACHGGRNLGGRSLHRLGLAEPFLGPDPGRAAVTGDRADHHVFKAPMLRHASRTGPWLHDGSSPSLEATIVAMGRLELGVALAPEQVAAIAALLRAVAECDANARDLVRAPELCTAAAVGGDRAGGNHVR